MSLTDIDLNSKIGTHITELCFLIDGLQKDNIKLQAELDCHKKSISKMESMSKKYWEQKAENKKLRECVDILRCDEEGDLDLILFRMEKCLKELNLDSKESGE